MPVDTSDLNSNPVTLEVHDRPPLVLDRGVFTIVVALAQDEVLALIEDLAKASASGGPACLVIEADAITYPRDAPE